tara:strand:+ start:836 stop:1555 length:720 start_codon:yes stop_codon:yes gene_type:complete
MIYVSLSTIPPRINDINKSIDSILNQTIRPDKIFINIPKKFKRFKEEIKDDQIPNFPSIVEVTRCDDCGPGTKLLGSINKLNKESLVILADDDQVYENFMIEKLYYYYKKAPQNAYSFYVHPLGNFGIGQGADGFAINTKYLDGIVDFYKDVVKDYHELFLYDDLWISYFLYFFKKNKILSLQELLEIDSSGKRKTIYKTHSVASGLISTYGKNINDAIIERDRKAKISFDYIKKKNKR